MGKQLKVGTTKTGNKAVIKNLLDTSNLGYGEVNIFLGKQLVTNITTHNFGLVYTTAYGTSHHGVTPFTVLILDLTTMAQIDISRQAEEWAIMINISNKKNASKGPPPLPSSYK